MASPERSQAQPIPASINNANNSHHEHELLHSLNKLSLSTSPTNRRSTSSQSNYDAQSNFAGEGRRPSVSPSTRASPGVSLTRANLNRMASDTRSTTPGLLRKASINSLHSANGSTTNRATSRRASSTPFLSPTAAKSSINWLPNHSEEIQQKPPPTAASVASAYLAKELELLHTTASDQPAETVVILHDACYGHRYSRPRATKNLLSTIVERPERIQASVLGVSMAYVRLGERHCEGKHPIHPNLDPKTLPSIPFRIHKTTRKVALSSAAVTNVHGNKWMDELKIMCDSAESKLALNGNELRRPEMNRGTDTEPPQQLHQGDLYLCSESLNAFEGALGAVCEAVDNVFSTSPHKRAFVAVRPPGHHCSASFPSGFCWVNNVHVGIMHGILNHGLTHAAIIDFDLHHGDGSQAIAWQHNKRGLAKNAAAWKKTSIGYFSVHDINSYPCEYGDEEKVKNASLCIDNAHGQNIWNVHLHEWKSDVEFWKLYQSKYSILLEKTRNYLRLQTERFRASGQVPKAAIFLSAGFDASEWEGAGMQRHKVNVPTEFYARLTRDVVRIASEEGLSVDGRVISVLEGGYSDRALCSGVLSHLSGLAGGDPIVPKEEIGGLGSEMSNRVGSFSRRSTLNESDIKLWRAFEFPYDPNWWSVAELDRLDAARAPPPPEPKKPRNITPGNYSSPTQSSSAKMTEVAKVRRSISNLSANPTIISRPPSPPPPDVPWTAAAYELSKLLIPNDRQIDSCKHSELNTESMKARKDRQSLQVIANSATNDAPAPSTRMALRERKPVSYLEDEDYQSRRKTVGGPTVPPTPKESAHGGPAQNETRQPRQGGRRLSAASTLSVVPDVQLLTNTGPRPGSSQSMRPESSMSVRTQASTVLNVKKTRPAAPPRKDSGRAPRAPRKVKPPPIKTEAETSTATKQPLPNVSNGNGPLPPRTGPNVGSTGHNSTGVSNPKDLDTITNGMKKIKINVLTKEQKEARQRAQAEKAIPEIQQRPNDMLTPKSESTLIQQPLSLSTVVGAQPNQVHPGIESLRCPTVTPETESSLPDAQHIAPAEPTIETAIPMPLTITTPTEPSPTSLPFSSSPLVQPTPEPARDTDLFVPYQPDGPPPTTIPIKVPIQILEPNTGTPARPDLVQNPRFQASSVPVSPVRRGGHGFTSTSNIPFSPRPVQETRSNSKDNVPVLNPPAMKTEDVDSGTWEILEMSEHGQ
ncbi:hypothetical protein F5Y19DRAFT_77983 [Xylariaceae sp. FL1651]|nr:hypothetical protein F5Y19DRAFT_77983 [Xylariaceae sp. FL1651]